MVASTHVIRDPLTRREIGIVVAWLRSGLALDGGLEERKPYARKLLAKLRAMWITAPESDGPEDDAPISYAVPPSQSPEIIGASAELWGGMDPPPMEADIVWREYSGALAACDVALEMGARRAAIVSMPDTWLSVRVLKADEIGCNWIEVWRPPVRKYGSPSRWDGNNGASRGGSRRSK